MKINPRLLIPPLIALFVLTVIVQRTSSALKSSGTWQGRARTTRTRADDPYTQLDRLLTVTRIPESIDRLRDPFVYGGAPAPTALAARPAATKPRSAPALPPPPPKPALTAIIWDNDPRAMVRYDGRDFSVREGSLFADFRVKGITRTQVVLERNTGEGMVLTLGSKGE